MAPWAELEIVARLLGPGGGPDLLCCESPATVLYSYGKNSASRDDGYVGSFFSPLVLRNRNLPLGVFADISTRTTQTEWFFRRRKAPMKTASLSLGASQQLEVRQLFDLLKTCLRREARLLEVFIFPLSPVTKFGGVDGSVPSLWGKVKSRWASQYGLSSVSC